jgi:hypothetical protein
LTFRIHKCFLPFPCGDFQFSVLQKKAPPEVDIHFFPSDFDRARVPLGG